jgi:hypothetical protein
MVPDAGDKAAKLGPARWRGSRIALLLAAPAQVWKWHYVKKTRKRHAVREMKVGPSESVGRQFGCVRQLRLIRGDISAYCWVDYRLEEGRFLRSN